MPFLIIFHFCRFFAVLKTYFDFFVFSVFSVHKSEMRPTSASKMKTYF